MNEFLKVALTACIPAMTVIFGWGLNKGVSIIAGKKSESNRKEVHGFVHLFSFSPEIPIYNVYTLAKKPLPC